MTCISFRDGPAQKFPFSQELVALYFYILELLKGLEQQYGRQWGIINYLQHIGWSLGLYLDVSLEQENDKVGAETKNTYILT